ncbi:aldo/keto reductase [Nocardia higoensis]|uniref:aldo/keto reductase n=1 Tax=Nocardia higoensis TaxID=228599 RepID=UPI0012F6D74E|nr:aldo/keto reductase [Nocardia higoensis]
MCLGTVNFGWTAPTEQCRAVLDRFHQSGGTFIDTADVYTRQGTGVGTAETVLGQWMTDRGVRDEIVVATKVGGRMFAEPTSGGLNRRHILRAVEASLRRLDTDRIDLYQAHWADTNTAIEETLSVMGELVTAGKIRYFGLSNFSPWRLTEAIHLGRSPGHTPVVTYQGRYSLIQREEFECWYAPLLNAHRLGFLAYSPLAAGLLTGKYQRGQPLPAQAARRDQLAPLLTEPNFAILDAVGEIAEQHGCAPATVALAWLLSSTQAVVPVVSANTIEQLDQLLAAATLPLDPAQAQRLEEVSQWPKPPRWDSRW